MKLYNDPKSNTVPPTEAKMMAKILTEIGYPSETIRISVPSSPVRVTDEGKAVNARAKTSPIVKIITNSKKI